MITKKVAKLQKELNELIKYSPNSTLIEDLKEEIELEFKKFCQIRNYWNEYLTKTNRKWELKRMKIKKLDKYQYEIINDDYIIYISKEQYEHNEPYIYFIDVLDSQELDDYKKDKINIKDIEPIDNEVFDELYSAIEYMENNFNIPKTITNQIKL